MEVSGIGIDKIELTPCLVQTHQNSYEYNWILSRGSVLIILFL